MKAREQYRFGSFTIDADERRLTRCDQGIPLPPKTFDVLVALVRRAGRLVTKRELLELVWPDSFVEEGILSVHISTLRKALDERNEGRSIETVARSGYRFRSDTRRLTRSAAISELGLEPMQSGQKGEASLAVLPFVNLSRDPENDYFSDGLTEQIIHTLAQTPGVRVIARTSAFAFKNAKHELRYIAHTLGVGHVLEGGVRKSGGRIRITARLVRADDNTQLWAESYDRDVADVFSLQDEIAGAIAAALKLHLPPEARRRYTPHVPAYETFLKGVHHFNKMTPESMIRARECLEEAIALDPNFVLAHCVLANYFIVLAANNHRPALDVMPVARALAERALEMEPLVPEAHSVVGQVAALFDFDWEEAERRQRIAMANEPVSPAVGIGYARHLMLTGRPMEGAEVARRMLEQDPLDLMGRLFLAHCLQAAGMDAAASAQIRQVVELDDRFWLAFLLRGLNEAVQARYEDAIVSAERAFALAPWNLRVIGLLAGISKRMGDMRRVDDLVPRLKPADAYGVPTALMLFHLACSEVDKGAEWAEKAVEQRDPVAVIHLLGPDTRVWRSSSRWPSLAAMMNLAAQG